MLFGSDVHASEPSDSTEDPNKVGRTIDLLGWMINLSTNRVMVSRKNQLKALCAFLFVDLSKPLNMRCRQCLCSLAERYSAVFYEFKVLMYYLYQMLGGQDGVSVTQVLPLPPASITAIRLWRFVLLRSEFYLSHGMPVGCDISYFKPNNLMQGILQFDGAPYGTGWGLFSFDQARCIASG